MFSKTNKVMHLHFLTTVISEYVNFLMLIYTSLFQHCHATSLKFSNNVLFHGIDIHKVCQYNGEALKEYRCSACIVQVGHH